MTRKTFNPRRAISREDLPQDPREAKFIACSSSSSVLVRTLKRTLLRNGRFQDLLIYTQRHANLLRQNRVLMRLKQQTDFPVTPSADLSSDDDSDEDMLEEE